MRNTFLLCRNIILPAVLYGCEVWSPILREEPRLRVSKYMVLRRIFGSRSDEVTGEWRRLHKKELYAPYALRIFICVTKSRRIKWAGHVARMGMKVVYTGFCGITSGKETTWKNQALRAG